MREAGGRRLVMKIGSGDQDLPASLAQGAALGHVALRDPSLPIPRVVETLDGRTTATWRSARGERPVRMVTFLDGVPLQSAPRSQRQRRNLGRTLARLALALKDFGGVVEDPTMLWDLQRAPRVRAMVDAIPALRDRPLVDRFLDAFDRDVAAALPMLRAQAIHNDANPQNVLVDAADTDRIAGLIDFGDMVHGPLVQELAVAASYQSTAEGHPLAGAADVVAGFHECLPLEAGELDLLYDLIATRLVLVIVIGGWRASCEPANREYVLRNSEAAWSSLARLGSLSRDEARAFLGEACREGARR
nr:phosphotransferase [Salinarimonas rosea]